MSGVCLGVGKSVMACSGGSEIKLESYSRRKVAKYKTHGVPANLKQEVTTRVQQVALLWRISPVQSIILGYNREEKTT